MTAAIWRALINKDWTAFAYIYNVSNYREFHYGSHIKQL
ncbi:DUF3380 domain-containing protein [Komagataeibacter melaceti]|uniref:DUF3380 domain-containing protein n=1 Tax=Komagataeibacter melaceti TaxID=2766577 RepID=A0A371YWG6_9PROT|nr:DUF3380 domain-containing protein [Komagataeibacter melaceti]